MKLKKHLTFVLVFLVTGCCFGTTKHPSSTAKPNDKADSVKPLSNSQHFCSSDSQISTELLNQLLKKNNDRAKSYCKNKTNCYQHNIAKAIKVYSNSKNKWEKVVYLERKKNWWGDLYFFQFKNNEIESWTQIKTYGAITTCVNWKTHEGSFGFFYKDSTHKGTKTENFCTVYPEFTKDKNPLKCKRIKGPYK